MEHANASKEKPSTELCNRSGQRVGCSTALVQKTAYTREGRGVQRLQGSLKAGGSPFVEVVVAVVVLASVVRHVPGDGPPQERRSRGHGGSLCARGHCVSRREEKRGKFPTFDPVLCLTKSFFFHQTKSFVFFLNPDRWSVH